ncbi:hypothetical protein ACTACB_17580 [Pseudomonas syringae]|uniref:hypothetical protein n=1 Tax=Pseudomonas syringae TaxID=317 RepID=UPI003F75DD27
MKNDSPKSSDAQIYLSPITQAALVISAINAKAGVEAVAEELAEQVKAVSSGDLSRIEAMLVTQAQSLDTLFAKLVNDALKTGVDDPAGRMGIALRAQAQCQATLQTLLELKALKTSPL